MSRKLIGEYAARFRQTEAELSRTAAGSAMLIHDAGFFAKSSTALPVDNSGNKQFQGAVSTGGTKHFFQNQATGFSHNKRGLATMGLSTVTSAGTGIGVAAAIGGGAAVVVASAAITGGIAVGVIALGIGITIIVKAYTAYQRGEADDRTSGRTADASYGTKEMVTDLEYVLRNGDLENLARYQDKAIEAGKLLDQMLAAPVGTCGDAARLAYGMLRFKHRLQDKLDKGTQMDHISNFMFLVENKIEAANRMCELLGEMHMANLIVHLAKADVYQANDEQKQAYGKSADVAANIRDYNALKWKKWFDGLMANTATGAHMASLQRTVTYELRSMSKGNQAELKRAVAYILKEAKGASDGDHNNICGKVNDALAAASGADSATATGGGHVGGTSLRDFTISQLQGLLLNAGKTAATSASVSGALGSGAIGSAAHIATSGGVGAAAGILVSALVGYALERANDRRNVEAIYNNTVTDPTQRIWLLRSMLKAGRVDAMADSVRKCQESITALQTFYATGDTMRRHAATGSYRSTKTTHADMVTATKHLFRLQKHMLRLFAANSVLSMFYNELYEQVDKMIMVYSAPGGAADKAIGKIKGQVEAQFHPRCLGTCYRTTGGNGNRMKFARRMEGAPNPPGWHPD